MTNPDFVIPFETATYPTLTCIDDPALVDTPYSSKKLAVLCGCKWPSGQWYLGGWAAFREMHL